jgi:major membrane immunogen (membrane-anchored lipoprotein)
VEKSRPDILANSAIFTKMLKVSYHPISENSPNLVTLLPSSTHSSKSFKEAVLYYRSAERREKMFSLS